MGRSYRQNRLLILDRAYDKAVKGLNLADMEEAVLRSAIRYGAKKAKQESKPRRDSIWKHFGWGTAEGEAKWDAIIKEIRYGQSF